MFLHTFVTGEAILGLQIQRGGFSYCVPGEDM